MDSISIYNARLNDILSLVTSMSSEDKLKAIEEWNRVASQIQTIVESNGQRLNQLSTIHDDNIDNDIDDDDYDADDGDGLPEIGITSPDRGEEFSTPALDSPPPSQLPAERHIASELSQQQPNTFSSTIDDTSYYDESFFSPTNMVDEMDQSTQREMDEQISDVCSSNVSHNYFNTRDSACPNSGSQITTTDAAQSFSNQLPSISSRSLLQSNFASSTTTSSNPQLIVSNETEPQSIRVQSYNVQVVSQGSRYIPCEIQEGQTTRTSEMSNENQSSQAPSEAEASAQLEIVHALLNNPLLQSTLSEGRSGEQHQKNEQDPSQSWEIARLANSLASNVDQPNRVANFEQHQSTSIVAQGNLYLRPDQVTAQQISTSLCSIFNGGRQLSLNLSDSNIMNGHQLEADQGLKRIFSVANSSNYLTPSASSSHDGVFNDNSHQVTDIEAPLRFNDVPTFDLRTGRDLHTCDICGKTGFSTKGNLKRHRNAHSGEKPYQCEQCDSRFTEKKSLKIHLRKHTGEKPYKCEQCDKVFSQAGVLKSHMAVHSEQTRKFKCSRCPRVFRQRSQLSIHLKRHDGVRDLGCAQCEAKFLTKGDLQRHFRTHTGERPYECENCGKCFTRQQSLNEHMNRHVGRKPHACKFCGKTFAEMSACYKHAKTHKVEVVEPHDIQENPSQSLAIQ